MNKYLRKTARLIRELGIHGYTPEKLTQPKNLLERESAWKGHETVIEDILERFEIGRERCLEFGVEFGFSAVVFSNYFQTVTGVDLFTGDQHTSHQGDHFEQTKRTLAGFPNIEIVQADYKDWIAADQKTYNLVHIDIVHTYEDTYRCGLWSAKRSQCAIFHDTESFPEVRKAVYDICRKTGKRFYNYKKHHGLGIVV